MAKPSAIAVKQAQAQQQQADAVSALETLVRRLERKLDKLATALEATTPADADDATNADADTAPRAKKGS